MNYVGLFSALFLLQLSVPIPHMLTARASRPNTWTCNQAMNQNWGLFESVEDGKSSPSLAEGVAIHRLNWSCTRLHVTESIDPERKEIWWMHVLLEQIGGLAPG